MLITYTKICVELWKMPKTRRDLSQPGDSNFLNENNLHEHTSNNNNNNNNNMNTPEIEMKPINNCKRIDSLTNNSTTEYLKLERPIRNDDNSTRKQVNFRLKYLEIVFAFSDNMTCSKACSLK